MVAAKLTNLTVGRPSKNEPMDPISRKEAATMVNLVCGNTGGSPKNPRPWIEVFSKDPGNISQPRALFGVEKTGGYSVVPTPLIFDHPVGGSGIISAHGRIVSAIPDSHTTA